MVCCRFILPVFGRFPVSLGNINNRLVFVPIKHRTIRCKCYIYIQLLTTTTTTTFEIYIHIIRMLMLNRRRGEKKKLVIETNVTGDDWADRLGDFLIWFIVSLAATEQILLRKTGSWNKHRASLDGWNLERLTHLQHTTFQWERFLDGRAKQRE